MRLTLSSPLSRRAGIACALTGTLLVALALPGGATEAGARVVAHGFPFPTRAPERYVEADLLAQLRATGQTAARIFRYPMPAPLPG